MALVSFSSRRRQERGKEPGRRGDLRHFEDQTLPKISPHWMEGAGDDATLLLQSWRRLPAGSGDALMSPTSCPQLPGSSASHARQEPEASAMRDDPVSPWRCRVDASSPSWFTAVPLPGKPFPSALWLKENSSFFPAHLDCGRLRGVFPNPQRCRGHRALHAPPLSRPHPIGLCLWVGLPCKTLRDRGQG